MNGTLLLNAIDVSQHAADSRLCRIFHHHACLSAIDPEAHEQ